MNNAQTSISSLSRIALVLLASAAGIDHAAAQTEYWVGHGPACTHSSVQAAIDASQAEGMTPVVIKVRLVQPPDAHVAQEIQISRRNLVIWGGWTECRQLTPWAQDHEMLSGHGGAAAPVIRVRDHAVVTLRGLRIIGGDPAQDSFLGGGVDWNATGTLTIDTTAIHDNVGVHGGGLRFHSDVTGDGATLILGADTLFERNVALRGGGLHLSGRTRLTMTEPNVFFHNNHATGIKLGSGSGGGIYVEGPAKASIGSPDLSGGAQATFRSNVARQSGGGIHVANAFDAAGDAEAALFSPDPANPMSFVLNTARQGGAMSIDSLANGAASICAHGLHVRENSAFEGAAVHVQGPDASWSSKNWVQCPETMWIAPPRCPQVGSSTCNVYAENVSALAVFKAIGSATLSAANLRVVANQVGGGGGVFVLGQGNDPAFVGLDLSRTLIDGNQASHIVDVFLGTAMLSQITIAGNADGPAVTVMKVTTPVSGKIFLEDSVVSQIAPLGNQNAGDAIEVRRTLSRNFQWTYQPPGVNGNLTSSAVFSDAAYRLASISPGVDHTTGSSGVDLDGNPADVDLPLVPNIGGSGDLGAYELQSSANGYLFRDGFEPKTQ